MFFTGDAEKKGNKNVYFLYHKPVNLSKTFPNLCVSVQGLVCVSVWSPKDALPLNPRADLCLLYHPQTHTKIHTQTLANSYPATN